MSMPAAEAFTSGALVETPRIGSSQIPMNAAAHAVLDQLEKRKNGSHYVFPHMQGEHEGEAIKDVKNSFRSADFRTQTHHYDAPVRTFRRAIWRIR
jgi:hypothetical protein